MVPDVRFAALSSAHLAAASVCDTWRLRVRAVQVREGTNHPQPCIHIYNHIRIKSYIHILIHIYIHTYIHTYIHIDMHTYIRQYTHTYSHAYVHNTCRHASVKASTHTCIRVHEYISPPTHVHTRACVRPPCECSGYRRAADSFTLVGFTPTHCHSRSLQGCVWVGAGGAHVEGNISLHYEQEPFDMQVSEGVGPTKGLGVAAFWGFKALCSDYRPRFVVGCFGFWGGK